MFTLLRTLSLGYFSQHRTRTALVILSIALGVGTLVATQALRKSLKRGLADGVNPLAGLADLLIVNGQTGVPASLAKELRQKNFAGVEAIRPFVLWRMSMADAEKTADGRNTSKILWLLGAEWPQSGSAQDAFPGVNYRLTYLPSTPAEAADLLLSYSATGRQSFRAIFKAWDEHLGLKVKDLGLKLTPPALVTEDLARDLKARKTSRFRLRNAGRTPELLAVGTIDFAATSLPLKNTSVVVTDLAAASEICFPDRPGHVHHIGVALAPGANKEKVRAEIKQWLGDRADVQTVDSTRQMVTDVTAGLELGFAIGGAGALVVGLFLVYNALSVTVAERRHDIGILRAVGATRAQIAGLFVAEAAVMGLSGSALGLPLGWLMATLALKPMANTITELLVPIDQARVDLSLGLMAVALVSGTLVAILAALVPALQAAGEEPADAVRRVPRRGVLLLAMVQMGAAILLLGVGFGLARFRGHLPERAGMFAGIVCLLVGGLVLTPLLAALVGRVLQPFFRHFFGLEGRLAADSLVRHPGRTGIVIAALAATGGLLVQTAGFLKSTREGIQDWVEEKIAADLFVSCGSPVTSGGASLSMQEGFQRKLEQLEGVETVLAIRYHQTKYKSPRDGLERIVWMVAVDSQAFEKVGQTRPLAQSLTKLKRLQERGCVVVSENFSALYGVKVGDTITIPGSKGELKVEVVGVVTDYTWNRGTIFLDRAWYREAFVDRQVDIFDLFLKPGADTEAVQREVMDRFGSDEALFVITRPEIHRDVSDTLRRVYSLIYAQQTVVGMVALLGVVSALFISVLQRRRELGLLRAVGASRPQILRSVLAEALLMGLVGAVVGFGIGLLLEWYVLDILILDESGFSFPLRVPWVEAGVVSLASVLFATLAGLWPAYLATRLRITEAIAYE